MTLPPSGLCYRPNSPVAPEFALEIHLLGTRQQVTAGRFRLNLRSQTFTLLLDLAEASSDAAEAASPEPAV